MAAPVASMLILPLDSGNTGKNVRTQTRVVGATTVHEHFFIPISERGTLGMHYFHSGVLTIPATAHTPATQGYLWLVNPATSTVKIALRRLRMMMQFTVLSAVDVSVPRQVAAIAAMSGVPSGAVITLAKRKTADTANQASVRTAITGLTVTPGGIFYSALPPINATASSATVQSTLPASLGMPFDVEEAENIVLAAGEGIVFYSADNSTTTNRRLIIDGTWEEFE